MQSGDFSNQGLRSVCGFKQESPHKGASARQRIGPEGNYYSLSFSPSLFASLKSIWRKFEKPEEPPGPSGSITRLDNKATEPVSCRSLTRSCVNKSSGLGAHSSPPPHIPSSRDRTRYPAEIIVGWKARLFLIFRPGSLASPSTDLLFNAFTWFLRLRSNQSCGSPGAVGESGSYPNNEKVLAWLEVFIKGRLPACIGSLLSSAAGGVVSPSRDLQWRQLESLRSSKAG